MIVVSSSPCRRSSAEQPFDIAEAETEILEGPFIEYSGPELRAVQVLPDDEADVLRLALRSRSSFRFCNGQLRARPGRAAGPGRAAVFLLIGLVAATHPRLPDRPGAQVLRRPAPGGRPGRDRAGAVLGLMALRGETRMWLASKIKQILMVMKPGVVTLKYPFEPPAPAPKDFRGAAALGPPRSASAAAAAPTTARRADILVRDVCQEICGPALRRLALHLLRPLRRRLPGEGHHDERRSSRPAPSDRNDVTEPGWSSS